MSVPRIIILVMLYLQVDGVKNAKLQSVFLEDLPIHKAAFANGGSQVCPLLYATCFMRVSLIARLGSLFHPVVWLLVLVSAWVRAQVIASGRRKHFYVFDLQAARVERIAGLTGRSEKSLENFAVSPMAGSPLVAFLGARGYVPLFSLQSRQNIAQLKMPGSVRSAAFSHDGLQLLASGRLRLHKICACAASNLSEDLVSCWARLAGAMLICFLRVGGFLWVGDSRMATMCGHQLLWALLRPKLLFTRCLGWQVVMG